MAKNYTLAEAAKIIAEGKDLAAIAELGKRFSLLTVSLASITALAGDNFTSFVSKFPENITANKVNGWLKNAANVSEDEEEEVWLMVKDRFPKAVSEEKEGWKEYKADRRYHEWYFRATRGVV